MIVRIDASSWSESKNSYPLSSGFPAFSQPAMPAGMTNTFV
jgi:hypothetical protein